MSSRRTFIAVAARRRARILPIAALIAAVAAQVAAQELPAFRKGQWQFERTIDDGSGAPQKVSLRKCTNPSDDMKRQNAMLSSSGCKVTPAVRSGATYSYSAQCRLQGVSVDSRSVLTAEGDGAYRLVVDSLEDGRKKREVLVARRVGDC
jgi:hypothetical protein